MDKHEFDAIFEKCEEKIAYTESEFTEKLLPYADDDGKLDAYSLAAFVYFESIKDSKKLIYDLLSELFVDKA